MSETSNIATTSFELVEVALDQYTIPDCPDCGEKMHLKEVGVVANPTKATMTPTWNLLKPTCAACGTVFLGQWDGPWMLHPGPDKQTGFVAAEKGTANGKKR